LVSVIVAISLCDIKTAVTGRMFHKSYYRSVLIAVICKKLEEGKMKGRVLVLSILLASMIAVSSMGFAGAVPQTPHLQIHIYLDQDVANQALQNGDIEIGSWPLTKEWISKWSSMSGQIKLCDYLELGMTQIDLNNQAWPTGDSNSKYYNPTSTESVKSVEFRKAVACLVDKDKIIQNVLGGRGYRMDVPKPPLEAAYVDMVNYSVSGYIYYYDKVRAEAILDNAGFTINPSTGIRMDPAHPGTDLSPIKICVRSDNSNFKKIGQMLISELVSEGIPVYPIFADRTLCYKNVMLLYDYNIYIGAWTFATTPDQYYDLYSSYNYYGPSVSWSQNYPGFCNHEFDTWAEAAKYSATLSSAVTATQTAGYLFLKYCAGIPVYCLQAFKACRVGCQGVINGAGYGIDNYWTFLNMGVPLDNRIDYGFLGDIRRLNVVTSSIMTPPLTPIPDFLFASTPLNLIYESLIGFNPYNLAATEFFLAVDGYTGTWDASLVGGDNPATFVNFTLRSGVYWHNETGNLRRVFVASDVQFSFDYQKACGPGVAWNYPSLAQYDHCEVYDNTHIAIFYKKQSCWAYQWAGRLPIINPDIWSYVPAGAAAKKYNPDLEDRNGDGVTDLKEDGTGAWLFQSFFRGNWITYEADPSYYLSTAYIQGRIAEMFHVGAGDVNRDGIVSMYDLDLMARAAGTNSGMLPWGTGWYQYNPDCDLNSDGVVDYLDVLVPSMHYGDTSGDC
jgi:ABC-type transport system substrate-binding protein